MKRLVLMAIGFGAAACSLDLAVPSDLTVTCTTNAECPEGSICDTNVGICVASETPTLRVDVPDDSAKRYTRSVPFTVEMLSANAASTFDLQIEFRNADESEVLWRPLRLALDSPSTSGVVGSPSGTAYELSWDALDDAIASNGLSLARVDLDADGQVADPIVGPARVIIRALARSGDGAVRSNAAESVPFIVGNAPPVATIADVIGESGVINVVVGLLDSNADSCGFELQFRGPDGVWRNAALQYGNTTDLGCLATQPLSASVGWSSRAALFDPDVQPPTTPQGVGQTIIPNSESTARVTVRARAYDEAEASRAEQHWGIWSPPFVIRRIVNQTSPLITAASAPVTAVAGGPGPVHIRYTVVDAESDLVDASISYSNDAGSTWKKADEYAYALSEGTARLASAPATEGGVTHLFTWDASRAHAKPVTSTMVRIVLADGSLAGPSTTVFQLGAAAAPTGDAPHDAFMHALFSSNLFRSDGTTQSTPGDAFAIADYNNDGLKDFVVAKREVVAGSAFSIFRNTGAAVPWPQTYLAGSAKYVVAANILNNPARQSFIALAEAGTGTAFAGNGNMTFAADTSLNIGGEPYALLARDLDNDGDDDFVVERFDGSTFTLAVYANSGPAGSRFTQGFNAVYPQPFAFDIGDLDRDGIADIALITNDRDGHVLRGNGAGQFTEIATFAGEHSNRDTDLLIGDANGDGSADLFNVGNGNVRYFIGSGTPGAVELEEHFVQTQTTGNTPAVADLNGDGLTDLVLADSQGFTFIVTGLDADGLPAASTTSTAQFTTGFAVADLDGDRMAELMSLSGNGQGRITVGVVDGPGVLGGRLWRSAQAVAPNDIRGAQVVGNFDGDGVPDLLSVDSSLYLRRGVGSGGVGDAAFGAAEQLFLGESSLTVREAAAADVNGDGALDVVLLGTVGDFFTGPLNLGYVLARPLQGVADGRFQPARLIEIAAANTSTPSGALVVGDFDGDGFDDAAYRYDVNNGSVVASLGVAFSRGVAGFVQQDATYTVPANTRYLATGYIGADSLLDLIATVPDDTARIFNSSVTPVNRANPFSVSDVTMGISVSEIQLADLNWDGVNDLWARTTTTLRMRNGVAGGGFGGLTEIFPNAQMLNTELLDLTGDGINDFVFLGFPFGDSAGVMAGAAPLGVPNGTFSSATSFVSDDLEQEITIAPVDVTCDTATDLVVAQSFAVGRVLVHERDGFGPQLSVAAPPYDGRHASALASLGVTAPPLHPWHIANGAPCSEDGRWEDGLRRWRAEHGGTPRFRVLAPGRYLGETTRYAKTRIGSELRWLRSSRFTPALDLGVDGMPRGLVATLTVAPGRRASVVPAKLRVYRQVGVFTSAAELPQDTQVGSADASRILAQLPTSHGLIDLARRTWTWEEVDRDGDGALTSGTGRRYVYDPATGLVDILTDAGGFYVVVEDL